MGAIKPLSAKLNGRLVVVSNRGPCIFKETPQGIQAVPSVSGLVSAIEPILKEEGGAWIAWGGRYGKKEKEFMGTSLPVPQNNPKYVFHEVMLSPEEINLFYQGFANSCLWPVCHNFIEKAEITEEHWNSYCKVNEKYAAVVLKKMLPDDFIWIHDYHLALLPGYIRKHRPFCKVSMFWHIPFPPPEIFAVIPWAREIITGMLDAELIGFHSGKYVQNFLYSAEEIAGAKVDFTTGTVYWLGRQIKAVALPIGINWRDFDYLASLEEVREKALKIRQSVGGEYLLLGVDRLDYTKGILKRLEAIAWLLEYYPEYTQKVTMIQIAVPSRTDTPAYKTLKKQIEEAVGRINGRLTNNYHVPVRYIYKSLDRLDLVAHYLAADMALVTSLRDGLNLVAKEYVAVNAKDSGILLLSPFAGAANQMKEALIANPYNPKAVADKIISGLKMPESDRKRIMDSLVKVVREQDVYWWWRKFKNHWLNDASRWKFTVSPENVSEVYMRGSVIGLAGRDPGAVSGSGFQST